MILHDRIRDTDTCYRNGRIHLITFWLYGLVIALFWFIINSSIDSDHNVRVNPNKHLIIDASSWYDMIYVNIRLYHVVPTQYVQNEQKIESITGLTIT